MGMAQDLVRGTGLQVPQIHLQHRAVAYRGTVSGYKVLRYKLMEDGGSCLANFRATPKGLARQRRQPRRQPERLACSSSATAVEKTAGSEPLHPKALAYLYQMYACSCLVERSWRFGLPLVLASVKGGFQTVAIVGFVSPVAVAVFGPLVGQALDNTPRQAGLTLAAGLQAVFIASAGLVLLQVVRASPSLTMQQSPLFPILLILSMSERLCAFAADVAVERDWTTQLAGKNNPGALAASNARLRRMDLLSELMGTLAFGWCATQHGVALTLAVLTAVTCCALPLELWYVQQIARTAPDIMTAERGIPVQRRFLRPRAATHSLLGKHILLAPFANIGYQIRRTIAGWSLYLRQPVLPASLAYILLMFNAVLSPGGLMTAFLASRGLTGTAAALFRSGCALMGFGGTAVGRRLIAATGLLSTGIFATSFQAAMLVAAAVIYHTKLASGAVGQLGSAASRAGALVNGVPVFTWAFCILIVVSRLGLWIFDMVVCQVFQTAVDPAEAASVSSTEFSLYNVSELCMLGIAAVASEPHMFGLLVNLSAGAVAGAAILFSAWALSSRVSRIAEGSLMFTSKTAA